MTTSTLGRPWAAIYRLARLWRAFLRRREVVATLRHAAQLDDRLLRDVGLTRDELREAMCELGESAWLREHGGSLQKRMFFDEYR